MRSAFLELQLYKLQDDRVHDHQPILMPNSSTACLQHQLGHFGSALDVVSHVLQESREFPIVYGHVYTHYSHSIMTPITGISSGPRVGFKKLRVPYDRLLRCGHCTLRKDDGAFDKPPFSNQRWLLRWPLQRRLLSERESMSDCSRYVIGTRTSVVALGETRLTTIHEPARLYLGWFLFKQLFLMIGGLLGL